MARPLSNRSALNVRGHLRHGRHAPPATRALRLGCEAIRNREARGSGRASPFGGRTGIASLNVKKGSPRMTERTEHGGFSPEERAAMKARAAELRAEGKAGAKKADGLQAVLDSIAQMAPEDRALAERVHVTVAATTPELSPRTWYGMPAYANAEGEVVVFFQAAGKLN